jgi:hypothetical protein
VCQEIKKERKIGRKKEKEKKNKHLTASFFGAEHVKSMFMII